MTQESRLVLSYDSTISTHNFCHHHVRARESARKQKGLLIDSVVRDTCHFCSQTTQLQGAWKSGKIHGYLVVIKCLSTMVITLQSWGTLYLLSNSWIPVLRVCAPSSLWNHHQRWQGDKECCAPHQQCGKVCLFESKDPSFCSLSVPEVPLGTTTSALQREDGPEESPWAFDESPA